MHVGTRDTNNLGWQSHVIRPAASPARLTAPSVWRPLRERAVIEPLVVQDLPELLIRRLPVRAAAEVPLRHMDSSSCRFFHASIPGLWW